MLVLLLLVAALAAISGATLSLARAVFLELNDYPRGSRSALLVSAALLFSANVLLLLGVAL
jgi:hypothetical protein